jgi:hypothetical protein
MVTQGRLRRVLNRATGRIREGVGRAGRGIGNFFARTAGRVTRPR